MTLIVYNLFTMSNVIEKTKVEEIIKNALDEDLLPNDDLTSNCLIPKDQRSVFELLVNEDAVLAGIDVFVKTFNLLDKEISFRLNFNNGDKIKRDQIVASVSGSTLNILKGERTALNFVAHLSGIATATNQLVKLIKDTGVDLLDTRKTTPGLRELEKKAVLAGGGKNHRFNLSEMILIKDNHIKAAGSIKNAVQKVKEEYENKIKIEVEVENIEELKEVVSSKPYVIMFDNWNLPDLKNALKLVPGDILTEVSGQISIQNIRSYAESGVKRISTSCMIKNARWIDFSLNIK